MVRRQTWILLAVFAALLGAAFYLQKNPLPKAGSEVTPSPTSALPLLQGWTSGDIARIESKDSQGQAIVISHDSQGSWTLGEDGKQKVETGLGELIATNIVEMRPVTALAANIDLEPIGLKNPQRVLFIRSQQGKQAELRIGNPTPVDDGYYVQLDGQAPVVIAKTTIDGTLDLFNNALPTATPAPAEATAAP